MKNRNYCFTVFPKEGKDIWNKELLVKHVKYAICQLEQAPTTKKLHYQGYLELNSPMRVNAVKEIFAEPVHLEYRKGTRDEAIAYCEKEDSRVDGPWEFGERGKSQGHRSDLDRVSELVKKKIPIKDIAEECPSTFIRYYRGIEKLSDTLDDGYDDREIEVIVYWGKTGTGKTRKAMEGNRRDIFKIDLMDENVWWDGYKGQHTLVIDEFYGQLRPEKILKLLDRYPLRLNVKGGSVMAKWNKIIITSNVPPSEWYSNVPLEVKQALYRRLTKVIELK